MVFNVVPHIVLLHELVTFISAFLVELRFPLVGLCAAVEATQGCDQMLDRLQPNVLAVFRALVGNLASEYFSLAELALL